MENKTNIQKADEVAGRLGQLGIIPIGKISPYTGFLSSVPATLTSLGVLLDKIEDNTATRNDYVHTISSLGSTSVSVYNLVRIGLSLNPISWPVSLAIVVTSMAIEYADARDYNWDKILEDSGISGVINDMSNTYKELLIDYGIKDIDFEKYISTHHKELDFEDKFLANQFDQSKIETKLEDIKNQLQDYLEKLPTKEDMQKEEYKSIDDETAKRLWEHILRTDDASLNNVKTFLENENNQENIKDEYLEENVQNSSVYRQRQ